MYKEEYAFFECGVTENVVPAGTKKLHGEFNEDPESVLAIAYSVQTTVLDSLSGDMVGDVVLSPKPKYSVAPLASNVPSQ